MYITEKEDIKDFLGVNIYKVYSDTYHLSHPQLINQIVSDLALSKFDATPSTTSALTTNILGKYQDVEKLNQQFHYRPRKNYLFDRRKGGYGVSANADLVASSLTAAMANNGQKCLFSAGLAGAVPKRME